MKELIPGRVLLISHGTHLNKLAILLSTSTQSSKKVSFKVLVLTDNNEKEPDKPDIWYKMLSLSKETVFSPIGKAGHTLLTISILDIMEICGKVLKINSDLVLKDCEKREIPRFKDDPPGQSCQAAIQELTKLTLAVSDKNKGVVELNYLDFLHDLKINDQNLYDNVLLLNIRKESVFDQLDNVQIPNFEEQFAAVFNRKYLEDQREKLKFQLSHASMSLYPDYESRILLLKELKYVNSQNRGKFNIIYFLFCSHNCSVFFIIIDLEIIIGFKLSSS